MSPSLAPPDRTPRMPGGRTDDDTSLRSRRRKNAPSDRRIPGDRNLAVTGSRLLDVGEAGERIMEALHHHLLGRQHVVHLAAGPLRPLAGLLVEGMAGGGGAE